MNNTSKSLSEKSIPAIFLITLILLSSSLFSQQQGMRNASPEERAKRQTEMMKTELNLTAVQEPKVNTINLKYAKKMQDVRKMTDTAAQRKSFESLNKQKDAELKPVLTADQFKAYQKMMADFKARRQQGQHK
jgi:hypothetical protein